MPQFTEQVRNKILDQADQLRVERMARQRRQELLQLAGQIAAGSGIGFYSDDERDQRVAEHAVLIAERILVEVDRRG